MISWSRATNDVPAYVYTPATGGMGSQWQSMSDTSDADSTLDNLDDPHIPGFVDALRNSPLRRFVTATLMWGTGHQLINIAQGYAEETILIAEGRAQRFNSIYEEYRKAKEITRERILLETMEKILPKVNKVISDPEVGKNFLPFLSITELQKTVKSN